MESEIQTQSNKVIILLELQEVLDNWSIYCTQPLPVKTVYTHKILTEFIENKLQEEKTCLRELL